MMCKLLSWLKMMQWDESHCIQMVFLSCNVRSLYLSGYEVKNPAGLSTKIN